MEDVMKYHNSYAMIILLLVFCVYVAFTFLCISFFWGILWLYNVLTYFLQRAEDHKTEGCQE